MSNLDLLAFQMGQVSPEPISEKYQDFYKWVLKKVFNTNAALKAPSGLTTIPISREIIHQNSSQIYPILSERLANVGKDVRFILIDLNSPLRQIARGTLLYHFTKALSAWHVKNNNGQSEIRLVLLVTDLPHEKDDIRNELNPLLTSRKLAIISEEGLTLPDIPGLDPDRFIFQHLAARGNPLDLLQKKLIRRYGHFQRGNEGAKYCVPIFYDGRFCEFETIQIFSDFLSKKHGGRASTVIAHHAPLSPWVQNAAVAVGQRRDLRSFDLDIEDDFTELMATKPKHIFLLLDMVDTGQTIGRILSRLSKTGAHIYSFSMMATSLSKPKKKLREIKIKGNSFNVKCALQVVQEKVHSDCKMCSLNLPINKEFDESDVNEPYKIRTFHMWSISQRSGTELEGDVPSYRKPLENLPRFKNFVRENGAWLVDKFRQYVDFRLGGVHEPLIVCPEESPAVILAEQMKLMLGWSVLQIPRMLINKFDKAQEKDKPAQEQTLQELKKASQAEILVMDVFNVSGRTLMSLARLTANITGKKPRGALLMLDLNPAASSELPCPILSLYSVQTNAEPESI